MANKIIGIYQITCTVNGKRYIGQSIDIRRRFSQHRRKPPDKMIRDFEQYGANAFKFEILEECVVEKLTTREDFYLYLLKPEYNIRSEGFDSIKYAAEHYGLKLPNISSVLSGKNKSCGGYHWEYADGQPPQRRSKEFRKKLSKPVRCVETGVVYESITLAARTLDVSDSAIGKVLNGHGEKSCGYHWEFCAI